MTLRERLLITPSLLVAVTLAASMAVPSTLVGTGHVGIAFAQNQSMMSNQTTNQTAMNQTATQMANETSTNQTSASKLKLTTSDAQDIRKTLEDVKKSIADGKAIEALKAINQIDDKLLVAMSDNPPPMLEKSTGNDNN